MNISSPNNINALLEAGVSPLYSIWITEINKGDSQYDINIWDENNNERV